jgi:hypothetical protein
MSALDRILFVPFMFWMYAATAGKSRNTAVTAALVTTACRLLAAGRRDAYLSGLPDRSLFVDFAAALPNGALSHGLK